MRYASFLLLFLITPVAAEPQTAHDFSLPAIDGKNLNLADYRGKALLVVNTASYCGFTKQYDGLQGLWKNYRDKGLIVLGVPSNDFGQQEPGKKDEIKEFCSVNFDVDFPMSDKLAVKGRAAHPFYKWLEEETGSTPKWNFHKFLIAPNGRAVRDFSSLTKPQAKELLRAVEAVLPQG
ncbi:MAG TPA: glutathione peroxidase [Rhodobiaceae bacterium]|nr:glutathione peroxidase [Rhodobiaceae bacterium]